MIGLFREGKLNVLVCTNIGSEGMDFKKCQVGPPRTSLGTA